MEGEPRSQVVHQVTGWRKYLDFWYWWFWVKFRLMGRKPEILSVFTIEVDENVD